MLTNCFETNCARAVGGRSRGSVLHAWLTSGLTGEHTSVPEYIHELTSNPELDSVGGFNLLLGDISDPKSETLAIISNRGVGAKVRTIGGGQGETVALSNMALGDYDDDHEKAWTKILLGERLTDEAIAESLREDEDEDALIQRLFGVLCTDTLPRLSGEDADRAEAYMGLFRESIFVPAIGKPQPPHPHHVDWNEKLLDPSYMEGLYGTQTQTVMLVGHDGRVRYVARTLYDEGGRPLSVEERDRSFEFAVET